MKAATMFGLLAGSVGARIAGAAIGLATQIVLARVLDPSDVGVVFLAMSMAAIFSLFAISGYPQLVLTEYPRLQFRKLPNAIAALHAAALWDWLLISCALAAVVALAVQASPLETGIKTALVVGALSTPFSSLIRYSSAIANSLKKFAVTFVPDNIIRPGGFMLMVLAAYFAGLQLSVAAVLAAYLLSNALAALLQLPYLEGNHLRLAQLAGWRRSFARVLRGRAAAIAIVAAVATSFADIVTLFGGFFLPAAEVALLGVTVRLAAIAGFVIQSAQQFVMPDLAVAVASRNEPAERKLLRRLNVMTLVILAGGLAFTVLFGRFLLQIFGPSYAAGYELLILLMLGQAVRALSGMNQSLLSIAGYQLRTAGTCIAALACFALCWSILQPRLGLPGIGVAVIVTELFWGALLAVQAAKLTGRRADLLWLARH